MNTWRLRLQARGGREALLAACAAAITVVLAYTGVQKLGLAGLLAPLGVVLLVLLLLYPLAMVACVVAVTVLFEGRDFGLFSFTADLYTHATVLNVMVALAVAAVALDMIVRRRALRLPRPFALALLILALGMLMGILNGHAAGVSTSTTLHSENVLFYLLLLPVAVANLDLDERRTVQLLKWAYAFAVLKGAVGVVAAIGHYGPSIEGSGSISYYEPAANWLTLVALLGVFAAFVSRSRPPLWMLAGSPLLIASLLLSYRRSFWIAAVLGLALVLVLALSPVGRRMLVPVGLLAAAAVWAVGSVHVEGQSPLLKRAVSLSPNSIQSNVEDRYRLDERANVLGNIGAHPITGLGIKVPWSATYRPLPIEHESGRDYVHFAALWFWLKLGILGLIAYAGLMLSSALCAWRVWRRSRAPAIRAFALASLCGLIGLAIAETTATFTGVDPRFTVLLAAQLGLLAMLAGKVDSRDAPEQPFAAPQLVPPAAPLPAGGRPNAWLAGNGPWSRPAVR